jgi:hypothetical protein
MNISLHLGSWIVPTLITVVFLLFGVFVFIRDAKGGHGDFSASLFGFVVLFSAVVASIAAWVVFGAIYFFL